jgi:hypothetical protein
MLIISRPPTNYSPIALLISLLEHKREITTRKAIAKNPSKVINRDHSSACLIKLMERL